MSGGSYQTPSGPQPGRLLFPQSPQGREYIIVPPSIIQRHQSPQCSNGAAMTSIIESPNSQVGPTISANLSPISVRASTSAPIRNLFSNNATQLPYLSQAIQQSRSLIAHRPNNNVRKPVPIHAMHHSGGSPAAMGSLFRVNSSLESAQAIALKTPHESTTEPGTAMAPSVLHGTSVQSHDLSYTDVPQILKTANMISIDWDSRLDELSTFPPDNITKAEFSEVTELFDMELEVPGCREVDVHVPEVVRQPRLGVDVDIAENMYPVMNIPFPIMHAFNLQLLSVIPTTKTEIRHDPGERLRPTARLLMRLGRSFVREQYHKQVIARRLRGVRPPPSLQDETKRHSVMEVFRKTLPPAGMQAATILGRCSTVAASVASPSAAWLSRPPTHLTRACAAAGCPYTFYSHLAMMRHCKEGHHTLQRVIPPGNARECLAPTMYPVNPLRLRNGTTYACPKCTCLFSSMKAIESHVSKCHKIPHFLANTTSTTKACCVCKVQIDRCASNLPVCQIRLRGGYPKQLWHNIRTLLGTDPARAISTHNLACFLLLPSSEAPLLFPEALMVDAMWAAADATVAGDCRRLASRYAKAISALSGLLVCRRLVPYRRIVEPAIDLSLEMAVLDPPSAIKCPGTRSTLLSPPPLAVVSDDAPFAVCSPSGSIPLISKPRCMYLTPTPPLPSPKTHSRTPYNVGPPVLVPAAKRRLILQQALGAATMQRPRVKERMPFQPQVNPRTAFLPIQPLNHTRPPTWFPRTMQPQSLPIVLRQYGLMPPPPQPQSGLCSNFVPLTPPPPSWNRPQTMWAPLSVPSNISQTSSKPPPHSLVLNSSIVPPVIAQPLLYQSQIETSTLQGNCMGSVLPNPQMDKFVWAAKNHVRMRKSPHPNGAPSRAQKVIRIRSPQNVVTGLTASQFLSNRGPSRQTQGITSQPPVSLLTSPSTTVQSATALTTQIPQTIIVGTSLTCPMCTFSSDNRDLIMQHVMDAH